RQKQGILHVLINSVEIGQPVRLKPLCVEMPADENESDQTGISLECVHPVPYPRILRNVGLAAKPNVNAVAAVEENRENDDRKFDKRPERNALQFLRNRIVLLRTDQNGAVRPEMFR